MSSTAVMIAASASRCRPGSRCGIGGRRGRNSSDWVNRRMVPNRARLVVGLVTVFLWANLSAAAEEPARQLRVEMEIPQRGDHMCVGFGSLWMMSDQKLMRIALADNAVTEIPIVRAPRDDGAELLSGKAPSG